MGLWCFVLWYFGTFFLKCDQIVSGVYTEVCEDLRRKCRTGSKLWLEFSADGIGNNNVYSVVKNHTANSVTVINRFCSTEKRRNKHTLQRQLCTFLPLVPIIACLFSRRPSAHFRLQRVIRIQTWSVWLNTRSSLSEEHGSEKRMRISPNHNIHSSAVCRCAARWDSKR